MLVVDYLNIKFSLKDLLSKVNSKEDSIYLQIIKTLENNKVYKEDRQFKLQLLE